MQGVRVNGREQTIHTLADARQGRTTTGQSADATDLVRCVDACTRQGAVHFLLRRLPDGLYVEREESTRPRRCTVESMIFADAEAFAHWCDADPLRFEYPLLYVNLKRDGDELLCCVA